MNIYQRKIRFKYLLFFGAVMIGAGSLWYTNRLVEKLANEERKKVELWAKATNLIINTDISNESLNFMLEVIQNNETVPVIVVDEKNNILWHRNVDTAKIQNPAYAVKMLDAMKENAPPIEVDLGNNIKQYLYYNRSTILTKLTYYPLAQLSVILLFILVAYFAFSSSRKAEQNQVWVGLSKETAHQLGTPISSLMAWKEILKLKSTDVQLISELEKDVTRLEKITERFSKIGSKPKLKPEDINSVIESAVDYLKTRSSKNVVFKVDTSDTPVIVPLNVPLFEWVLENICKNSMDAIDGNGLIHISVIDNSKFVFVDITDNGKGIPRSRHKTIFKPGYTTKERGWGLGLSLTKRIVEEYHSGKIFVASSEPGKGTTIRVILNTSA
jgi:signal transduction histidine kinase